MNEGSPVAAGGRVGNGPAELVVDGPQATIWLHGSIDVASSADVAAVGALAAAATGISSVVLDMTHVEIIDSTGLGALIAIRQAAEEAGVAVRLRAVPPIVDRLMGVAGLRPVFDVPDEDTARC